MTHDEFESIAALEVIGAASAEEESALRAHLVTCESCRRARDEFKEAATLMAQGLDPVAPPAEVRQGIMACIEPGETTLVESRRRFALRPWWLATAAILFLFLWGWRELAIRAARERIAARSAEILELTAENDRLSEQVARLNSELTTLATPGTRILTLTGQQNASARAFLDPNGRGVVIVYSLPPNPADKSYQLWVIRSDQPKPQSAAVFDIPTSGSRTIALQNLPTQKVVKALAVTLEPKGGVEQPTNTNFYLMGKS